MYDPKSGTGFVVLSNIYTNIGQEDAVKIIRVLMEKDEPIDSIQLEKESGVIGSNRFIEVLGELVKIQVVDKMTPVDVVNPKKEYYLYEYMLSPFAINVLKLKEEGVLDQIIKFKNEMDEIKEKAKGGDIYTSVG